MELVDFFLSAVHGHILGVEETFFRNNSGYCYSAQQEHEKLLGSCLPEAYLLK